MLDTFKSEARMFRVVVKVGLGAAAVIALTLLTDALWGVVLAIALIALWTAWVWTGRSGTPAQEEAASRSSGPSAAFADEPDVPDRPLGPSTGL